MERIASVRMVVKNIRLRKPFRTALREEKAAENVFIIVESSSGVRGFGEAAPLIEVTGENPAGCIGFLNSLKKDIIGAEIPKDLNRLLRKIHQSMGFPAGKAAIEMALLDLYAKIMGLSFVDLLGGKVKESLETDYTISLQPVNDTIKEALEIVDKGFKILKVKLGEDPRRDLERIKTLRENLGYNVRIRVDANQGWSPKQAIWISKRLEKLEIELIEQPVPYWCVDELKMLRESIEIPIAADESAKNLRDVLRLVKIGAVDVVNIKLMKCGGPLTALKISDLCEEAAVKCMIGCGLETRLSITAAASIAYMRDNIIFIDLDSPLFIDKEPVIGGINYKNGGIIKLPHKNGLGIRMANC
ncbi:MAG: dipeptide epimerase [Thaumarchaeota archaeon]|nr:MAG: dipeptide epimerase [Nitrososphaerota archaeon]